MSDEKAYYEAPFGKILFKLHEDMVSEVQLYPTIDELANVPEVTSYEIIDAFDDYFSGDDFESIGLISVNYREGTPYQERVWQMLRDSKPGETFTYGEVARALDSSPLAVGNACRDNPLPLIIPCHRVIARHCIGGFCGASEGKPIETKAWLLEHERSHST